LESISNLLRKLVLSFTPPLVEKLDKAAEALKKNNYPEANKWLNMHDVNTAMKFQVNQYKNDIPEAKKAEELFKDVQLMAKHENPHTLKNLLSLIEMLQSIQKDIKKKAR
jgi:hypothetical protein